MSGQSDALVMLIAFAILTPLAAGVVLMAVVMLATRALRPGITAAIDAAVE